MYVYIYRENKIRNTWTKELWHMLSSGFAGHRLEVKDRKKQHGPSFSCNPCTAGKAPLLISECRDLEAFKC